MSSILRFCLLLICLGAAQTGDAFKHPGLNLDADDITFIRARLKEKAEPWTSALAALAKRRDEFLARAPQAVATYTWPPHHSQPGPANSLRFDGEVAYGCALLFTFADDQPAGAKAVAILDAWSSTLTTIAPEANGNQGHKLSTGYLWPAMQNTAELLRRPEAKGIWKPDAVARFVDLQRRLVLPVVNDRATSNNAVRRNNWNSMLIWCHLSTAVFIDDRAEFDKAVARWREQLPVYVAADGKGMEFGRDLWHTQMGYGPLVQSAEIAWKQDLDLYKEQDHRLLKACEYHIPFIRDAIAKKPGAPKLGGADWMGHAEVAYNHFVNRLGMKAPVLEGLVMERRPEPFERMGWGTLTHGGDRTTWKPGAARPAAAATRPAGR